MASNHIAIPADLIELLGDAALAGEQNAVERDLRRRGALSRRGGGRK